jgi:hypothetical protein
MIVHETFPTHLCYVTGQGEHLELLGDVGDGASHEAYDLLYTELTLVQDAEYLESIPVGEEGEYPQNLFTPSWIPEEFFDSPGRIG